MKKLNKKKKNIDYGLPAVDKLIGEAAKDISKKIDSFFIAVGYGFENVFTH